MFKGGSSFVESEEFGARLHADEVSRGIKAQVSARKNWEYKVVARYGVRPASLSEQDSNKPGLKSGN